MPGKDNIVGSHALRSWVMQRSINNDPRKTLFLSAATV